MTGNHYRIECNLTIRVLIVGHSRNENDMDNVTIVNCSKHGGNCEEYSGYHNYETFNVGLWLDNTRHYYDQIQKFVEVYSTVEQLANAIKNYVMQQAKRNIGNRFGDLTSKELKRVDWIELADVAMEV